jgi:hypothetical protein
MFQESILILFSTPTYLLYKWGDQLGVSYQNKGDKNITEKSYTREEIARLR